jgi:hypothetical protein
MSYSYLILDWFCCWQGIYLLNFNPFKFIEIYFKTQLWSSLVNIPDILEKNVYVLVVRWSSINVFRSRRLLVQFTSSISLLGFFYLFYYCERNMIKSPTMIMDFYFFFFELQGLLEFRDYTLSHSISPFLC